MDRSDKKRKLLRDLYTAMEASELKFLRDLYDACGGIANPISLEDLKGYSAETSNVTWKSFRTNGWLNGFQAVVSILQGTDSLSVRDC